MSLKVYEHLEQGSSEWLQARAGIITASTIGQLITDSTVKVANNPKSRSLINHLAAERITGRVEETYQTQQMIRGHLDEPLARYYYSERYGDVDEVGFFLRNDDGIRCGYSPDGLVGEKGLIEIKSREPKIHIATVIADEPPAANMAQLQAGLYVTGRDWIDYVSFASGLPLWVHRVEPDEIWQEAIETALVRAEEQIDRVVRTFAERIKGFPPTEYVNHWANEIR